MKAKYKNFIVLTGCVILAAAASAQDAPSVSHAGGGTNSMTGLAMEIRSQPTVPWADHAQVSGLLIDLVRPQQTWSLLNPAVPAPPVPPPQSAAQLQTQVPITASARDGNVENRGPNFAVLRFSFP